MNNMIDLILCKYYFIHNKEKKEMSNIGNSLNVPLIPSTDNAIKNHWNSALRRELRKLNRQNSAIIPVSYTRRSPAK